MAPQIKGKALIGQDKFVKVINSRQLELTYTEEGTGTRKQIQFTPDEVSDIYAALNLFVKVKDLIITKRAKLDEEGR